MTIPKWKEFEELAYNIQRDLAGGATVTKNDLIKGHDSQVYRQIDISVRRRVAQFPVLVVIECKDYKVPVDVPEVGAFVTVVKDVRANKGAMISSRGFTKAAINLARQHGIDTFRLVDTKARNWQAYVTVPVLMQRAFLKFFRITLTSQCMAHRTQRGTGGRQAGTGTVNAISTPERSGPLAR